MASKDFFTWAGKSSASMFCHFNSSRAIVLLQLGRTKRAYAIHLNAIKRLLQEDGYAARDVIGWPSIVTPLVGIRHRATEAISNMGCPRLFRPARRLVVWCYSTSASLGR